MSFRVVNKNSLEKLYSSGLSMAKIAQKLNCSEHKVVYWMGKYNLKRRTRSEAAYLYFNPDGDPFKVKEKMNPDERFLFGLGLGIYWGEGEKVSRYGIRVANTDPGILKVFIRFLLEICRLNPAKLGYSIVCFNDSDIEKVRSFWSREMKLSSDKFGKIVQIKPQGKGIYRKKSKHGVCTVTVGNVKLKKWMMTQIRKLRSVPG